MEHSERIQSCEITLLILFGNKPWFDSIEYHVINSDSVPQVNCLLHPQNSKYFKLNRSESVQKHIQLLIYILLNTFIDSDNELVRLILRQLPLCIDYRLHARMNELLLKHVQVLKLVLFVNKVVLQCSNGSLHIEDSLLLSMESHC